MNETWFGCPLCGRSARTSRELTAMGCEGKHIELVPAGHLKAIETWCRARQKDPRIHDPNAFLVVANRIREILDKP